MAENQSILIGAHPTIYNGYIGRELRIDFSLPSAGMNAQTGIILLVPGFGGNIDSKVYKKMREELSDGFNMLTVQSAFFGDQFMQSSEDFIVEDIEAYAQKYLTEEEKAYVVGNTDKMIQRLSTIDFILPVKAKLTETENIFNDMGIMQAIDLITTLEAVKILLDGNDLEYNSDQIIGYGHSHGAYLLHLVNRIAPNLLSNIIDNSGWIEPAYLKSNRYLFQKFSEMTLQIEFDYLAKRIVPTEMIFSLDKLYNNFENQANILTFQGTNDNLIDHEYKQKIFSSIPNTKFILIDEKDVDGIKYKSNTHGLNADFLEMFKFAYKVFDEKDKMRKMKREFKNEDEVIIANTKINIDYSNGLPVFVVSGY
ncbi:hypothetical protein CSV74_13525 [Sporosarcina sp. P19]|uniref:DUF2920 family protein n=1 Tax=Sporosarcina sp. P19 TaxID=2048258 RepID=UPI000C166F5C|nr:DUF2920 family protein [Sporosarcina sp. P19]PIC75952.1 hypothetical protein CSV74_13525 [Sporosarcina sp. P19]